jgi:hypothetical protein
LAIGMRWPRGHVRARCRVRALTGGGRLR